MTSPDILAGTAPDPLDYERDPEAIYRQSFATVRSEAALDRFDPAMQQVVVRLIHSCGLPSIAGDVAFSPDAVAAGVAALQAGRPVLTDVQMVRFGIIGRMLEQAGGSAVHCLLDHPEVPARAKAIGNTRSAAAVEFWRPMVQDAVVVIGNAPTALFHLLELLDSGWPKPALILGFPVGFVGAAESKAELAQNPRGVPFMVLQGRLGGSAIAAAAVNALAGLAAR